MKRLTQLLPKVLKASKNNMWQLFLVRCYPLKTHLAVVTFVLSQNKKAFKITIWDKHLYHATLF